MKRVPYPPGWVAHSFLFFVSEFLQSGRRILRGGISRSCIPDSCFGGQAASQDAGWRSKPPRRQGEAS